MNNEKKFIKLTPFKMQVLQSFPFIDADFDAITNYELLCKVVEYLNTTVDNVNLLETDFKTLYDYVHDYFDNLDVQEEINNKLDEMAESGQLTDIIAQYLGLAGMITFDTVADMKLAENLVNGSKCCTLGFYNINDGGNALYKIRTITNEDIVDEAFIIALHNNTLVAELIINDEVNIKQLGAYGDNTHDDTTIIRNAIKKLYDNEVQSGWRRARTLYFPKGVYKIDSTLIDSTLNVNGLSITFKGNGKHTTIIKTSASVLFDNQQIFGFVCFENMRFEGDNSNIFMNYASSTLGNAQNTRFNQCSFSAFKTIINASGTTMTSENTFFECSISGCGSDELPCELFIFNNAQSVNWRFYATDIESFIGVLFKYLRGANVTWYQGSCIPLRNSTIIDGTNADPNYFGQGNSPYLIMNQVRIEMRENSCLLNKGHSFASFKMIFNECGMGGANIPSTPTVKTINLGDGNNRLTFNACSNFDNYSFSSTTKLSSTTYESDNVDFNYCSFKPTDNIEQILSRSDFQYTGSATGYLPSIKVNGIKYRILSTAPQFNVGDKFEDVIIQNIGDPGGISVRGATVGTSIDRTYYINGYIKNIKLAGISKPAYGSTAKFTCQFYDDNNNLLGEIEDLLKNDNNETLFVGKYINTLKMTTTSDYSGAVAVLKILIISVERL